MVRIGAALRGFVLVVIAAAALCLARPAVADRVVVYGYPLASRCPAAGVADAVDRWGMYACNCTSYVAWALSANHQRVDWFVRGSMDAWNWPNVAHIARLTVDRTPTAG